MSHHHESKKHKKQQQIAKTRHHQQIQHQIDTLELGRILEKEREEELREASMAAARLAERQSAGEETVWSAKVQMNRNKLTGRMKAAEGKWGRFSGTSGAGARGL